MLSHRSWRRGSRKFSLSIHQSRASGITVILPHVIPPQKPFDSYEWRWAELVPSENLDRPEIYLGVLRALRQFENRYPNDPDFLDALDVVAQQTGSPVNLRGTK